MTSLKSLTLSARLTIWYTLALAAALGVFGAEILWTQQRLGTNRIDRELDATAATVWNVVRSELQEHNGPAAAAEEARSTVALPGRAVAIFDTAGRPLTPDLSGPLRLNSAVMARFVRAPIGRSDPMPVDPPTHPGQPGRTIWTVGT